MRNASALFLVQALYYVLVVVNYRAVAHGGYVLIAGTDVALASLSFWVIARIASLEKRDGVLAWMGFASGSAVGSILGLALAKAIGY